MKRFRATPTWSWRRIISLTLMQLLALAVFLGLILLLTGCSGGRILQRMGTSYILCQDGRHMFIVSNRVTDTAKCDCEKP